ncbi:hypothetical protein ACFVJW_17635 [Streptomyces libani]|uniref:hypothetical protein n=1 Tax=Streptomyces nigrescens TaxID=1920 RepID=UPI00363D0584
MDTRRAVTSAADVHIAEPGCVNECRPVRGGFEAFKKAYEEYVPWLVRKAIEVGASVYEISSAMRDFIGL